MYGNLPKPILNYKINLPQKEIRYLYLPIKMTELDDIRIPDDIEFINPLVSAVAKNNDLKDKYLYVTIEYTDVKIGQPQRRPGWHSDGFMTNDVNLVYYSTCPTEFALLRKKIDLRQDHKECINILNSMEYDDIYTYPAYTLLQMDQTVIHRVSIPYKNERRLFIKFSISDSQYNLIGNTHNNLFNYNWKMYNREEVRNHPVFAENDSITKEL